MSSPPHNYRLADGSCNTLAVQAYIRLLEAQLTSQGVQLQAGGITCAPQQRVAPQPVADMGLAIKQLAGPSQQAVPFCNNTIFVITPSSQTVVTLETVGDQCCQVRVPPSHACP